ncbi:hypothetical protein [Haloferax volcanii]|uniref:hypothetical protein n=1 Tax=Haloferax volcanii TaxID=2246 RepID=UPI0023DA2805|nr:hypothetical protein [Haloferax lucentense]
MSAGALAIAAIVVLFGPEFTWGLHRVGRRGPEDIPRKLSLLVQVETFITTFNLVVLLVLAKEYVDIYRGLPNKYTRSMLLLSVGLLLYAFTSNPLTALFFGFKPNPNIGPFAFLPDLFVGLSIIVLYYQSQT